MFKIAYVSSVDGLKEARDIMQRIYDENPKHWPHGLSPEHFDGGVYLIREKRSNKACGFAGWQERREVKVLEPGKSKTAGSKDPLSDMFGRMFGASITKVGYYSIGILPEHRRNHYAKEALSKLIAHKSAGVDRVRAMIVAGNSPSIGLARRLGVDTEIKRASLLFPHFGFTCQQAPQPLRLQQ
jgi:RimJ/RimL family protein N-acetyltransferase